MGYTSLQLYRIENNICINCHLPRGASSNKNLCQSCVVIISARARSRRAERLQVGKCTYCGRTRDDEKFKFCKKCRETAVSRYGDTAKVYRKSKTTKGICTSCTAPSINKSRLCQQHFEYRSMSQRAVKFNTTVEILYELLEKQDYKCYYTGTPLIVGINASLDHKIPKSRHGSDDSDNLVWCTKSINSTKNNKNVEEFLEQCRLVVRTLEMKGY